MRQLRTVWSIVRALVAPDPEYICQHLTPRWREPEYAGRIIYVDGQLRRECPVCFRTSPGVTHHIHPTHAQQAVRAAAEALGGAQ